MAEKEKTAGELRREALCYAPKNGYDRLTAEDEAALQRYCEDYKRFLDAGKTERECVSEAIRQAEAKGFRPFVRGMELKSGDKILPLQPRQEPDAGGGGQPPPSPRA